MAKAKTSKDGKPKSARAGAAPAPRAPAKAKAKATKPEKAAKPPKAARVAPVGPAPVKAHRREPRDPPLSGPSPIGPDVAPTPKAAFPPGAATAPWLDAMSEEQRQAVETLAVNLARASMTAQTAMAGAAGKTALPSADPFHVAPAMAEVAQRLAADPESLVRAQTQLFERYLDLWKATASRMTGETPTPTIEPAKNDKRFRDPDWSDNPVFDVMKQSYLISSEWLNGLVGGVDGVDPMTKRRVEFFTKMLTDAFSPSNYLLTNPAALREAMASQGQSLVKGAEQFAADLARGGGQLSISQTDFEKFKVGENVATAPGKVVFQNELFQLLQFSPATDKVFDIPLLILPPWINKYYILDLRPDNSMIRWLAAQGFTVFVASWVNPEPKLAGMTLEDYMNTGAYAAVDAVLRQTGSKTVNTVGYCIGGTLLACTLAHMASKGDKRISAATFFAAQQDFAEAGDLLLFTDEAWLEDLEKQMDAAGGVLPGQSMADTFNALRGNDLIWSFFVNNYLMGKEPAAFDLLFWNSDQTRMPKALHMQYLRDFYRSNKLSKNELAVGGVKLDLGTVKTPVYVQSSKEDHIAPMRSVYRGAKLFGGPTTFTLAGSGHIAGVVNAPMANKYQHWTNPALPATVEEWVAGAVEHPGSWWPHWAKWLGERSGGEVASRDPAQGPLGVIEDAPGSYVKVRSQAA